MRFADAFIQSDLRICIAYSCYTYFCQYVCSLEIEPTTLALLTQCSTTEPQEHNLWKILLFYIKCHYFNIYYENKETTFEIIKSIKK